MCYVKIIIAAWFGCGALSCSILSHKIIPISGLGILEAMVSECKSGGEVYSLIGHNFLLKSHGI